MALRERVTSVKMMARTAMNESPLGRVMGVVTIEASSMVGWNAGDGRSFERARKMSRMKEENDVKLPQKPVLRPMKRGIVFLTRVCRLQASARSSSVGIRSGGFLSLIPTLLAVDREIRDGEDDPY